MSFAFASSAALGVRPLAGVSVALSHGRSALQSPKKPRPARLIVSKADSDFPTPPSPEVPPPRVPEPAPPTPTSAKRTGSLLGSLRARLPSRPPKAAPTPQNELARAARGLWHAGWLTWWVQLVLTTISAVILCFAFAFPGVSVQSSASALGLILTGLSVAVALVSLFWTYSYTRFSVRLTGADGPKSRMTLSRLGRFLRVGGGLALAGVLLALLGLQATVGTLLARVFSAGAAPVVNQAGRAVFNPSPVQAVDILVVQATANALSSLFAAMVCTSWLRARLPKWQAAADKDV